MKIYKKPEVLIYHLEYEPLMNPSSGKGGHGWGDKNHDHHHWKDDEDEEDDDSNFNMWENF